MSKDIRSFFQPKKVLKTKVEEDDDVIPESPDVEIKIKKRESRKKRILSDSDEEIFSNKKKKSDEHSSHKISKHITPVKKELKEVKAVDIFGTAPIKRTGPIVKSLEKKTESGIHSDDDFDQSLLELDEKNHSLNNTKDVIHSNININEEPFRNATNLNKSADGKSEKNNRTDTEIQRGKKRCHEERNSTKQEQATKTSDSNAGGIHQSPKTTKQNSVILNNSTSDLDMNTTKRKKKLDTSLNETGLTDEERYERKRHSAALYQKYLNRSGPKHLGTKQIPEGAPNCLKNCAFLLTGVLDSFEREEVAESITRLGGIIKNSISKKVTHVLAGEDAGPAKIAKAQELGIMILNEDDFLELIINNSSAHQTGNVNIKDEKANRHFRKLNDYKKVDKQRDETQKSIAVKIKKELEKNKTDTGMTAQNNNYCGDKQKDPNENNLGIQSEGSMELTTNKGFNDLNNAPNKLNTNSLSTMWVEKYKPQNLKQIIGQHGESSNVKKLCNWLTKWYVNRKAKLSKPSPWAKNDDGGYYKAALLSGPPGVGKTTTVTLVCKELGFDMVEFNASDTRNKSLIREQIGELLTTTSLSGYAKGLVGKQAVTKKHVLVMDEVDGMAGNEDRGGLQELIGLIKTASVPIICMCNDRNSQKMRSLVNYCYDLRFNRPRVDQIKAAMMSVCCKEGLKLPGEALAQLAVAANQDVRQTLNLLSLWAADRLRAGAGAGAQARDAAAPIKDVRLGPWEAIRKVFSAEDHKTMSIHDKSDLFFHDYSLAPLFVQENYLQVAPHCPKHEVFERLSRAADSISAGDLVDARIRGAQAWNLLPIQAMYSSVIPGHAMSGHITGQIQFPGWLGKNSRRSKMQRLCQEIHAHTRLSTSGSKSSIFLDYCTHLRDAIMTPLVNDKTDGIARSLEVLEAYHLLREDLESLTEMSLWPGQRNPMILIDSKVKAAMTRTYNKTASALPYAPGAVRRARNADADGAGLPGDADDDDDGDADDQQHDSDPENDQLIKKRKVKEGEKCSAKKDAPSTSKDKPTSSKGKGKKK